MNSAVSSCAGTEGTPRFTKDIFVQTAGGFPNGGMWQMWRDEQLNVEQLQSMSFFWPQKDGVQLETMMLKTSGVKP